MNCKICGYSLTGSDQNCKNCGTAVNNVSVQNNGVNTVTPVQQIQPVVQQQIPIQPVNNNTSPEVIPAMNFVQGPQNVQQPVNNIQQNEINNIPVPQPVNSSPILEQKNINNIQQPQNIVQPQNNNEQISNNQPLQQVSNINNEENNVTQQPINVEQPVTTNTTLKDNNSTTKPKNNNLKFILIGVVLVLLIAVVSVIVVKKLLNKESQPEQNNEQQIVNKIASYNVKYNGFSFKIPTNLIYVEEGELLAITDEADTKVAYIDVMEGAYSNLVSNINMISTVYQELGYTVEIVKQEKIGNTDFIIVELSTSGTNMLLVVTKANSMNLFIASIINVNNEYDYDYLNTIANILISSEYSEETNAITSFKKVDTSILSDLMKEQE